MKGDKNRYQCHVCGGAIFTIDLDTGVTPFMIGCRATKGCRGFMESAFYRIDQTLIPDLSWYEWYDARPNAPMLLRPILNPGSHNG